MAYRRFFQTLKNRWLHHRKDRTGKAIRKLIIKIMEASIKIQQLKSARSGQTEMCVDEVFTEQEEPCLEQLNIKMEGKTEKQKNPHPCQSLSWALWVIARLGGWNNIYDKKRPPGTKTFICGLERFEAMKIGFHIRSS
jgi:hypothetical protein